MARIVGRIRRSPIRRESGSLPAVIARRRYTYVGLQITCRRRYCYRFATVLVWEKHVLCVNSEHIALPVNFFRNMFSVALGAHRGRPVAAALCTPGLWPPKSPLRGSFDLSRQAPGRAEAASLQITALSPHPCGLPRPAGNVSAILRPPTPQFQ